MDQVRGRVSEVLHFPVGFVGLECMACSTVAVLADQAVDLFVLTEAFHPRRDSDEFATVGNNFPSAIDRLIRHPGAFEFLFVHEADDFPKRFIKHVHRVRPCIAGRSHVGLNVITDVETTEDPFIRLIAGLDGQHVYSRHILEIVSLGHVEAATQGGDDLPEGILAAAARGHDMRRTDGRLAAETDEKILVVVSETQDLVRDDLPNADHNVVRPFDNPPVDLNRDRPVSASIGHILDKFLVNLTDCSAGGFPVVGMDSILGDVTEHPLVFFGGMRQMLSEGRDDIGMTARIQQMEEHIGEIAPSGVIPSSVGRHEERLLDRRFHAHAHLFHQTSHHLPLLLGVDHMSFFIKPHSR